METPVIPPRLAAPAIAAGMVLDGRYRLIREIGRGGMGRVFEALNVGLGKRVAVKVLHPDPVRPLEAVRRFVLEAQLTSRIDHDNVVQIIDYGVLADGVAYYVMEYLAGRDLAALLPGDRRLPWSAARGLFVQIARGIRAAHQRGVVHRDLKPANVFVLQRRDDDVIDRVKVLDFGIAHASASSSPGLYGTIGYIAPEVAAGARADPRSDVYAMGVLMYRVLTGRLPFARDDALAEQPPHCPPARREWAADIPAQAQAIVLRCLAHAPQLRVPSMRALEQAIATIAAVGEVLPAPRALAFPLVPRAVAPTQELGDAIGRRSAIVRTRTAMHVPRRSRTRLALALAAAIVATLAVWRIGARTSGLVPVPTIVAPAPPLAAGPAEAVTPSTGPVIPAPAPRGFRFEPEAPPAVQPPPRAVPRATPPRAAPKATPPLRLAPRRKAPPAAKPPKIKIPRGPAVTRRGDPVRDAATTRRLVADAIALCRGTNKAYVFFEIEASGRTQALRPKSTGPETECLSRLIRRARYSTGARRTHAIAFQAKPDGVR